MNLDEAIEVVRSLDRPRVTYRERYAIEWVCRVAGGTEERPTQNWTEPQDCD